MDEETRAMLLETPVRIAETQLTVIDKLDTLSGKVDLLPEELATFRAEYLDHGHPGDQT